MNRYLRIGGDAVTIVNYQGVPVRVDETTEAQLLGPRLLDAQGVPIDDPEILAAWANRQAALARMTTAHDQLDALGEEIFVEALRQRGWSITDNLEE